MLLSRPLLRIIRNDGLEKAYIDVWMWCCANWPHTGLPQLNIVSQIGLRLLRLMGWNGKLKSIERGYPATPKNDDVARFSGSSSLLSAMKLDAVLMTFSVGSRHSERSLYHIADAAMPTHNYIVTHELLTIFFFVCLVLPSARIQFIWLLDWANGRRHLCILIRVGYIENTIGKIHSADFFNLFPWHLKPAPFFLYLRTARHIIR